ncbi:VOC family protein [Spirosoma koreense]
MTLEHLAIWVDDLARMRSFYMSYFAASSGEKYVNPTKSFTAYFLLFGPQKTRLELMHRPDISDSPLPRGFAKGLAHFAISVGGKDKVDQLTERLRADGYSIASEPRTTGDGYYESAILDPEGNYVEISA